MLKKLIISLSFIMLLPITAAGTLQPLANAELETVTGQSGITVAVRNVQLFQNIENYIYNASDNGFLMITNLQSDVIKYNFGTDLSTGLIYMDVGVNEVASMDDWNLGTNPTSFQKGMFGLSAPNWDQEVSFISNGLIFSFGTFGDAYHLGEFGIGQIRQPSYKYFVAPHGQSGIDFEYDFEMHIDSAFYYYRLDSTTPSNSHALLFENIHIGQSFGFGTGGDDPSDPNTWTPDIGQFKIGDMFGDWTGDPNTSKHSNPAQLDAGVCEFDFSDHPLSAYRMRMPFEGSIRFENAEFGGTDFGPGAIDGINAYRFDVYLFPAVP